MSNIEIDYNECIKSGMIMKFLDKYRISRFADFMFYSEEYDCKTNYPIWHFNANDFFSRGQADSEEFSLYDLIDIESCIQEAIDLLGSVAFASYGIELWMCRKRNMPPCNYTLDRNNMRPEKFKDLLRSIGNG